MLTYLGITCNDCNLLLDILSKEKWECVYRKEGGVGGDLSCGFEGFQNNKLFLLNPNSAPLQPPPPDFVLDVVALLTHPHFPPGLPFQKFYPWQLFISSSLIMSFGCLESICFQGCWSLPMPFSYLSPEPKPDLYSFAIFKYNLYSPSIFNRGKWYLRLSDTIHLLLKSFPLRPQLSLLNWKSIHHVFFL